jgi:hypothetical protein
MQEIHWEPTGANFEHLLDTREPCGADNCTLGTLCVFLFTNLCVGCFVIRFSLCVLLVCFLFFFV